MEVNRTTFPLQYPWCIGAKTNVVKKNAVKRVEILNRHLALYRKRNNELALIDDVCPHRGARLSSGRVKNDCLECPYHGWLYNEYGKLEHVPSIDKGKRVPSRADITNFKVKEGSFMTWMYPTAEADDDIGHLPSPPECTELLDKDRWDTVEGQTIVNGNWIEWIMNGLDISHINFVHEFADEDNGVVKDMHVYTTPTGVRCVAKVIPKASTFLTGFLQVDECEITSEFIYPNSVIIK